MPLNNPFDSSSDDDDHHHHESVPPTTSSSNPFDESSHDSVAPPTTTQFARDASDQQRSHGLNPFDEPSHDSVAPPPPTQFARDASNQQRSHGLNPFDEPSHDSVAPPPPPPPTATQFARGASDHGHGLNPFDDDGYDHDNTTSPPQRPTERSQLRASASETSAAALKKVRVFFKDTGTRQASKLVEEAAQKIKGSGFRSESGRQKKKKNNGNKDTAAAASASAAVGGRHELFDEEEAASSPPLKRYGDDQFRKQDLEYRNVEELEGYALQKSGETTSTLNDCLIVAGEMQEGATKTLLALHSQGEQIKRTHQVTLDMDENLSRGEKMLGNLGGIFSKKWKPKKSRPIVGPAASAADADDSFKRRAHHLEQRVALGINATSNPHPRLNQVTPNSGELQTTQQKLDAERMKQDDALTKLSDVLDTLKGLTIDMGSEISSQTEAMDQLEKDTETLNGRMKDANQRGRRLLKR